MTFWFECDPKRQAAVDFGSGSDPKFCESDSLY